MSLEQNNKELCSRKKAKNALENAGSVESTLSKIRNLELSKTGRESSAI